MVETDFGTCELSLDSLPGILNRSKWTKIAVIGIKITEAITNKKHNATPQSGYSDSCTLA